MRCCEIERILVEAGARTRGQIFNLDKSASCPSYQGIIQLREGNDKKSERILVEAGVKE